MYPQGMHLIPLPFNEDVRGAAKAQNIAAPPDEAVNAAAKVCLDMCVCMYEDVCGAAKAQNIAAPPAEAVVPASNVCLDMWVCMYI